MERTRRAQSRRTPPSGSQTKVRALVRTVLADAAGFYQFPGLVSGTYSIEAEVSGLKKYRNAGVILRLDEHFRADIIMEVGQVTESVEVSAGGAHRHTVVQHCGMDGAKARPCFQNAGLNHRARPGSVPAWIA
jgi:hypothetical protein